MNHLNGKLKPAEVISHQDVMRAIKSNRKGFIDRITADPTFVKNSIMFFKGGETIAREETDHELLFRQESNFYYLFGVRDSGCYGILLPCGKSVLFIPRLDISWEMWIGPLLPPSYYKDYYNVDECYYIDELDNYITKLSPLIIYTLYGYNSDSGEYTKPLNIELLNKYRIDNGLIHNHILLSRIHKNNDELVLLRYACRLCSIGHIACMNAVTPGIYEFQLESVFLHATSVNGESRYSAFTSILGSGRNSSICHYGHSSLPNDKIINDGDIIVSDQGCLCYGYSSDITTTFPANGKFTPLQRNLYEAVLDMNWSVQDSMKPGVKWFDMHKLAYKVGLTHMLKWGLVKGTIEELLDNNVCSVFMPHGLGHFMGVDTHDVGGYAKGYPERPTINGFKKLRTNCILEPGMLITVEPGLYFITSIINESKNNINLSKYINYDILEQYYPLGGCRLEDDVLITDNSIDCLTCLPRLIDDVEAFVQGKKTKLSEISNRKHYHGKLD